MQIHCRHANKEVQHGHDMSTKHPGDLQMKLFKSSTSEQQLESLRSGFWGLLIVGKQALFPMFPTKMCYDVFVIYN